jgi:hypothetical protein
MEICNSIVVGFQQRVLIFIFIFFLTYIYFANFFVGQSKSTSLSGDDYFNSCSAMGREKRKTGGERGGMVRAIEH